MRALEYLSKVYHYNGSYIQINSGFYGPALKPDPKGRNMAAVHFTVMGNALPVIFGASEGDRNVSAKALSATLNEEEMPMQEALRLCRGDAPLPPKAFKVLVDTIAAKVTTDMLSNAPEAKYAVPVVETQTLYWEAYSRHLRFLRFSSEWVRADEKAQDLLATATRNAIWWTAFYGLIHGRLVEVEQCSKLECALRPSTCRVMR